MARAVGPRYGSTIRSGDRGVRAAQGDDRLAEWGDQAVADRSDQAHVDRPGVRLNPFWMQATFAVVVAVFFAGERLSMGMRRAALALYLIASILAAVRWAISLHRNLAWRTRLIAEGHGDIPSHGGLILSSTVLTFVMFFAGVAATIYFITRPGAGRAPQ